jgi:preprotein translocase subunit SecD
MVTRDVDTLFAIALTAAASWACSPSGKARVPDWKRVPVSLELRLAEGSPAPGLVPAAVYGQGKTVYLHPEAQLSNSDIAKVEAVKTRIGKGLILQVWLTRAGAARIKEATGRHIGDSLAVLIDSVVVAVPMIQQAIGGDPKLPNDIGVPLEPKEAQQLAAAVSKTWPPAPAPSGRKVRKD